MSREDQRWAGMEIGVSYPAPIVDHAAARRLILDLYGRLKRQARKRCESIGRA